MNAKESTERRLDLKGKICPRALIMTMSTIKTLEKGQSLFIESTDPSTKKSIPNLCERAGFTLVDLDETQGTYRFHIRK